MNLTEDQANQIIKALEEGKITWKPSEKLQAIIKAQEIQEQQKASGGIRGFDGRHFWGY